MTAERWPLDFEKLQRGDVIASADIESISGVSQSSRKFPLEVLKLSRQIEQHFDVHRGEIVCVISQNDNLRILTVPEQARYTRRQAVVRRTSLLRTMRKGMSVDLAQLTEDEARVHEDWQARESWRIQQMNKRPPPKLTDGNTTDEDDV